MLHSSTRAARRRLVLATGNPGKLEEFRALLRHLPFDIVAQTDCGIPPVDETGSSFAANALLKARHAATATGAAAIGDDSGLEVDALGGAPGIFSARYAGRGAADAANNAKLRSALAGVPMERRQARYRCALVFVAGPDDRAPLCAESVWEGLIMDSPRGGFGFGYDAYFWVPERSATAAELEPAEKNLMRHRGTAMRLLAAQLK